MSENKDTPRLVAFTYTETFYARIDGDTADRILPPDGGQSVDTIDIADEWDRLKRTAIHGHQYVDADLTVDEVEKWAPWDATFFDDTAVKGDHGYLWSARHFTGKARTLLSQARYREGNCPDVDALNRDLDRIEERIRVMALEADPGGACR